MKVETVQRRGCAFVGLMQRRKAKSRFDELQKAAEFVLRVIHVARLRVWRDAEQRHAETESFAIELRRRHVVVPSAPIVPRDEDGRRGPQGALSDRIDD